MGRGGAAVFWHVAFRARLIKPGFFGLSQLAKHIVKKPELGCKNREPIAISSIRRVFRPIRPHDRPHGVLMPVVLGHAIYSQVPCTKEAPRMAKDIGAHQQ